jgi:hypothetical protein
MRRHPSPQPMIRFSTALYAAMLLGSFATVLFVLLNCAGKHP